LPEKKNAKILADPRRNHYIQYGSRLQSIFVLYAALQFSTQSVKESCQGATFFNKQGKAPGGTC